MSDRYYLLRNNRESGPFLLGELLQQCLLPGDLVWVEGRSQNWHQPAEVPEIGSALPKGYSLSPAERPAAPEHISDRELALRAESIRRRALAALYQQVPLHQGTPRTDMATGPVYFREEDAVEIVQHKPAANRSNVAEFMLFCTLSSLVVLGWRSGIFAHLVQVRPQAVTQATQLVSESANAATAVAQPVQQAGFLLPQRNTSIFTAADSSLRTDSSAFVATSTTPRPRPAAPKRGSATDSGALSTGLSAAPEPKASEAVPVVSEPQRETVKSAPEKTDKPEKAAPEKSPSRETAVATAEKKPEAPEEVKEEKHKGFGLFRGLFKKKKKDEAEAPANGG